MLRSKRPNRQVLSIYQSIGSDDQREIAQLTTSRKSTGVCRCKFRLFTCHTGHFDVVASPCACLILMTRCRHFLRRFPVSPSVCPSHLNPLLDLKRWHWYKQKQHIVQSYKSTKNRLKNGDIHSENRTSRYIALGTCCMRLGAI